MLLPSGFNRPYRDIVKYIKSYTIEELSNVIFLGCYMAKVGPPGFLSLWKHLQPALHHYIYGYDDDMHQQRKAHEDLVAFASLLEQMVRDGKVCLL